MRFWQKIFLLTLSLLLISFQVFSFILISNNFQTARDKEITTELEEVRLMRLSMQTSIIYEKYLLDTTSLTRLQTCSLLLEFADSYYDSSANTTIEIAPLDNMPAGQKQDVAQVVILQEEGQHILQITSFFTAEGYPFCLTTQANISHIYAEAQEQISFAQTLSLFVSLGCAVVVLLLSLFLTRQIHALRRTSRKMSRGLFFTRAKIHSHDEIGELAEDFNSMADTIETKITELSQIADDRKRFIDNLAHEMKTPLTSIIGFADLLRTTKLEEETKIDYADAIYKEGRHLKNISSKLMELILLGKTTPTLQPIAVDTFLQDIYQSIEPICKNAQIQLRYLPPQEDFSLLLDAELMKSVVTNLIDNAIKASKPNSEIILSAGTAENPFISVQDFGRGIPQEEIGKITEPFYMLDKARTRKHGGAGLGLALCAEIATLHQSRLDIQSQLGVGTKIQLLFEHTAELEDLLP